MSECKQDLIGSADGVTCKKCGLHLTHKEYQEFLKPKPAQEEKSAPQPEARAISRPLKANPSTPFMPASTTATSASRMPGR